MGSNKESELPGFPYYYLHTRLHGRLAKNQCSRKAKTRNAAPGHMVAVSLMDYLMPPPPFSLKYNP